MTGELVIGWQSRSSKTQQFLISFSNLVVSTIHYKRTCSLATHSPFTLATLTYTQALEIKRSLQLSFTLQILVSVPAFLVNWHVDAMKGRDPAVVMKSHIATRCVFVRPAAAHPVARAIW